MIYMHAYMHTCIHAYMHTCIHTYIHTYIHIFIYIYICLNSNPIRPTVYDGLSAGTPLGGLQVATDLLVLRRHRAHRGHRVLAGYHAPSPRPIGVEKNRRRRGDVLEPATLGVLL